MNRHILGFLALIFSALGSTAQTDCRPILTQAQAALAKSKDPKKALTLLQDVEICDYQNKLLKERQSLQKKIFDAIEQLRKGEKAAADLARKQTEAAKIALQKAELQTRRALSNELMYKVSQEQPLRTTAFRLAEYGRRLAPDNPRAADILYHAVYLDTTPWSYAFHSHFYDFLDGEFILEDLEFAPAYPKVISTGFDGTARIWDMEQRRELQVIQLPGGTVGEKIADDGSKIWTKDRWGWGQDPQPSAIFEVAGARKLLEFPASGSYFKGFSPDGKLALVCEHLDSSTQCTIWDLVAGQQVYVLSPYLWNHDINNAAFSPDGRLLVVYCTNFGGLLYVWDIESRQLVVKWEVENFYPAFLSFSSDGSNIFALSMSGSFLKWDFSTGETQWFHSPSSQRDIFELSPDDATAATTDSKSSIVLINANSGAWHSFKGDAVYMNDILLPASGGDLISAGQGGISTWKLNNTSECLWQFPPVSWHYPVFLNPETLIVTNTDLSKSLWSIPQQKELFRFGNTGESLDFFEVSPDGTLIAFGAYRNEPIHVYDIASATELAVFEIENAGENTNVKFLDNERLFVASFKPDYKGSIFQIFDIRGGTPPIAFQTGGAALSLDIFPDSLWLATGDENGEVIIWSLKAGSPLFQLKGHTGEIHSMGFSPDGSTLISSQATAGGSGTKVWDIQTEKELYSIQGYCNNFLFFPDGKKFLYSQAGKLGARELRNGNLLYLLPAPGFSDISFAAGSTDQLLLVNNHRLISYPLHIDSMMAAVESTYQPGYLTPLEIEYFELEESFEYAGVYAEINTFLREGKGIEPWLFSLADYFLLKARQLKGNPALAKPYYEKAIPIYEALEKKAWHYLPETYRERAKEAKTEMKK